MTNRQIDSIFQITLLRHAESAGNADGYFQGQLDYPLTGYGKQQANHLAKYWVTHNPHFDLVISSPLLRARNTAEIICAELNIPLEIEDLWMERNAGKLQGLNRIEAQQLLPQPTFINPYLPFGGNGESQWELYLRAGGALNKLLQLPPSRYLIVSHGGLLNMVLYAILGISPQANFQGARFDFLNTAYANLTYSPANHHWRVLELNNHPHLNNPEA